jgi:hypothetical protein
MAPVFNVNIGAMPHDVVVIMQQITRYKFFELTGYK